MGKKLDALKFAVTTKPKLRTSKEAGARYAISEMYIPFRSDTTLIIGATLGALFAMVPLSNLFNLPFLFTVIVWILIASIGIRAAGKLANEWIDENLEITIKWKQKSDNAP